MLKGILYQFTVYLFASKNDQFHDDHRIKKFIVLAEKETSAVQQTKAK